MVVVAGFVFVLSSQYITASFFILDQFNVTTLYGYADQFGKSGFLIMFFGSCSCSGRDAAASLDRDIRRLSFVFS